MCHHAQQIYSFGKKTWSMKNATVEGATREQQRHPDTKVTLSMYENSGQGHEVFCVLHKLSHLRGPIP